MSTSEYLEISSNERNEDFSRGGRAIPKKLVGGVVLLMVVVGSVMVVSSSRRAVPAATQEKNLFVSSAADSVYYPLKCTPGTYPSGKSCKRCPIGNYCNGLKIIPCPSSHYQDCEGQAQCILIPCGYEGVKGKSYTGGYTDIRACAKGSYRRLGMPKCALVPAGSYGNEDALCDHIPCYEGSYQSKPGQLSCPPCPCGEYTNQRGQTSCKACGAKKYQPNEGERECLDIPFGFVAASKKRCNIKRCGDGEYRSKEGYIYVCKKAPCGKYVPIGGSSPLPCQAGSYQPQVGQTSCVLIPKGYELVASSKRCKVEKCQAGYYQNEEGLDECKKCRPGSFASGTGSYKCDPCPCGEISASYGSTSCDACKGGEYQPSAGQSSCVDIPLGYELGAYGPYKPRCGIKICQPGTYRGSPQKKDDKCSKCPKGSAVDHPGALECPPCRCGKFANQMGQAMCKTCGSGLYQDLTGQQTCKPIPAKKKAHPSKCSLISYYQPPPSPVCKEMKGGGYADIKKGKVVDLGSYASAAGCLARCKSSGTCRCSGYETSSKKCYICSEQSLCKFETVYVGSGFVYGQCTRY